MHAMGTNKIVPAPSELINSEENFEKCHDVKIVDLTFDEKEQKSSIQDLCSQNIKRKSKCLEAHKSENLTICEMLQNVVESKKYKNVKISLELSD